MNVHKKRPLESLFDMLQDIVYPLCLEMGLLMRHGWCVIFLIFSACQPASLEDYTWEGAQYARELTETLKKIRSREDLIKTEPLLRQKFMSLADLIIQARKFWKKHPEEELSCSIIAAFASEQLLEEMQRIYCMEGGRECIERAAHHAMLRLNAEEKRLLKYQRR